MYVAIREYFRALQNITHHVFISESVSVHLLKIAKERTSLNVNIVHFQSFPKPLTAESFVEVLLSLIQKTTDHELKTQICAVSISVYTHSHCTRNRPAEDFLFSIKKQKAKLKGKC